MGMGGVGEWSVVTRDPAPPVTQECVHTVHSAHVVASVQCTVCSTLYTVQRGAGGHGNGLEKVDLNLIMSTTRIF